MKRSSRAGRLTQLERNQRTTGIFFILPSLVLCAIFMVVPLINVIRYSLTDWDGLSKTYNFVGLYNYMHLHEIEGFGEMMLATVTFAIGVTAITIIVSFLAALALDKRGRDRLPRGLMRALWFFPALLSGAVCLVLALLTVLCCFRIDAAILNLLGSVFRGLIGAGFYILPFSFVMSFLILILHDGRPVALRVTCTFLTAALVGSLVQLVGGSFDAPEGWEVVTALWDGGISGTAGGVLSGGLASLLAALISRIGAVIVVIVGMLLSLITSLNMTVESIVTAIKNRPRAEYAEPQREHKDTAQAIVDTVATHHIEHVRQVELAHPRRAALLGPLDMLAPRVADERVRPAGRRSSPARRDAQKECKAFCAHAAGCFCGEQPQAGKAVRSARAGAGGRGSARRRAGRAGGAYRLQVAV